MKEITIADIVIACGAEQQEVVGERGQFGILPGV